MPESVVWYAVVFGTAVLFFCIGAYAEKREKPMSFWSGTEVDASGITDILRYNKENGKMWKLYSLWFWAAGILGMVSMAVAFVILIFSCTIGLGLLVRSYRKIERKYRVQ